MRSLLLLSLIGLATVTARAQDSRIFNIAREHSPAIPGSTPAIAEATSSCLEHLIARESPKGPMVILFPSGKWTISRTLILPSNCSIRGMGTEFTTLQTNAQNSAPVVMCGLKGTFRTAGVRPKEIVPASGVLDPSVTAGIGLKLGRLHVSIPYQSWSFPQIPNYAAKQGWDRWDKTTAFTFDFAIDVGVNGITNIGTSTSPIAGMEVNNQFAPFGLIAGQGFYWLYLKTSDGVRHVVKFASDARGLVRLSMMADAANGTVRVLVNKVAVPVVVPTTFHAGLAFTVNDGVPFKINGMGPSDGAQSDRYTPLTGDGFTVYGACLTAGVRWPDGTTPGTDAIVYRVATPKTIAYLPLNDDPAYLIKTRMLRSYSGPMGGNAHGVGYVIDAGVNDGYASEIGVTIQDMTVRNPTWYGHTVALGLSLSTTIKDASIFGGAVGLGVIQIGSNYLTTIAGNCSFQGMMTAMLFRNSIVDGTTGQITIAKYTYGLNVIDCKNSTVTLGAVYMLGTQTASTREFIRSDSTFTARFLLLDNETNEGNMEAILHAEINPDTPMNLMSIDDVIGAGISPGAVFAILDGPAGTKAVPALVRIGTVSIPSGPKMRAWYDVRDARWTGMAKPLQVLPGVPFTVGKHAK